MEDDLPSQKGDLAKFVILLAEPYFVFHVNGSSCSVEGKSMKRCLAEGSSGRLVNLLPGTTFLHIRGPLLEHGYECEILSHYVICI